MGTIRSKGACYGKVPYKSQAEAATAVRTNTSLRGRNVKPYRCPLCGQWHVGHRIKKNQVESKKH